MNQLNNANKLSIPGIFNFQNPKSQSNFFYQPTSKLNSLTGILSESKLIDLQELSSINILIKQIKATQQSLINSLIQKHLSPEKKFFSQNNFLNLLEEINQIQSFLPHRLTDIKFKRITQTNQETTIELEGTPLPPKTVSVNPEESIQETSPPCEITRTIEKNSYKGLHCILEMPQFKVEHLTETSSTSYKPYTEVLSLNSGQAKIITKLPTEFEIQNQANSLYGLIDGIFIVERTETETITKFFITPIQGHATFQGTELKNPITITANEGEKLKKYAFSLSHSSLIEQPNNTNCSISYIYTPKGTLLISLTIGILSILRTKNK